MAAVSAVAGDALTVAAMVSAVGAAVAAAAVASPVVGDASVAATVAPVEVDDAAMAAVAIPDVGGEATTSCPEGDWWVTVALFVDVALVGLEGVVVDALEGIPWSLKFESGRRAPAGHHRSGRRAPAAHQREER